MKKQIGRREMLKRGALAGAGLWLGGRVLPARTISPLEKLNIACVGIGGRGGANLRAVSGENIVALCDVDDNRAGNAYKKHPKAKKFYDFRRMYDKMEKEIDAVVVSTPDHTHFHAAYTAMQMGKHCFCEKPMAHCVSEIRAMTEIASEKKLATQLGVQRHVYDNMHRVVELIRARAIGEVRECYAWVGGSRGMPSKPKKFPPVPSHLKWDLWLGPAEKRPYSPAYCPYKWRFWWDFGTGETGNWGCHIVDIPFWALDLKYPTRVDASGPPVDPERTPKSMKTHFKFPAHGKFPPVTLHWYHTKEGPEILRKHNLPHFGSGALFVGSEGMLLCGFRKRKLFPEKKFKDFEPPKKTIPRSPGFHKEWINACKGGKEATCNFNYSGPLAETVILGNTAYRAQEGFDWDAENLKASANGRVNELLHEPFRKGWEVKGYTT